MLNAVAVSNIFACSLWILVAVASVNKVESLRCWKCIAHDCDTDPEDNFKATKVDCSHGEMCMKVRYKMFDNKTHYDSVVRTCSDRQCLRTTEVEFMNCINTPKHYMIGGCTLRSCCEDRDLCNYAKIRDIPFVILSIMLLVSRL